MYHLFKEVLTLSLKYLKYNKPKHTIKPKVRVVPPEGLNPYKEVNRYAKKSKS